MHNGKRQSNSGSALSEYGLLGTMVAVSSIAALVLLGGSVSDVFYNMSFMSNIPSKSAGISEASASTALSEPAFSSRKMVITTQSGTAITLNAYPSDLTSTVETLGVNGATSVLSDNLESVANQMLAAGEITQEQYNSLINLANKGHELAKVYGIVEQYYENWNSDLSGVASLIGTEREHEAIPFPITYNGQTYTTNGDVLTFMKSVVGWTTYSDTPLQDPSRYSGTLSAEFQLLYNQSKQNGAMNDPAIDSIISSLASKIFLLNNVALDNVTPSERASVAANLDSADICSTSGATDSGVQCY